MFHPSNPAKSCALAAASIIFLSSTFPSASYSQESSPSGKEAGRPPILDKIELQGLKILGELNVPGGLRGYAAKAGAQPLTLYITPDNKHVIVGTLVDELGQDLAEDQVKKMMATPLGEAEWKKLELSNWVPDGDESAKRVVYTFTDPNCPYCNKFWHAARPWVDAGKVQLRHVMVGVIRQDSPGKAAAILDAASPEKALRDNELKQEGGGIAPVEAIPETTRERLDANANLMTQLGFGGTPAIVYRKPDNTVSTISGLPEDAALEAILGPK